jgi:hypothetical protein
MTPHFNVLFCTPGNAMKPGYVRSLLKTTNACTKEGLTWNYLTEYSSLVAHAREMTLGGSHYQDINNTAPLHGTVSYDVIMWIDSDISWEPIDFFRLYESDKPVISGCYQIEDNSVTAYREPLGMAISAAEIMSLRSPIPVFGVGFGFLAVKRGIFEAIKRPWFSQEEIMVRNKDTGEDEYKFPLMGEDLSWCNKVQKMGIPIYLDPNVRVSHQKVLMLDWSDVTTDWSDRRA